MNIRIRVAGIIVRDNTILMAKHKKNNKVAYLVPGGGMEYGESAKSSLKREFQEELRMHVMVNDLLFVRETISPTNRHILHLFFLCDSNDKPQQGEDERVVGFEFFDAAAIENNIIYPNIKSELIDILQGRNIIPKYKQVEWI